MHQHRSTSTHPATSSPPSSTAPISNDFHISDRFRIVSRLGEGAAGIVYQAFDREHDSSVAVKRLRTLDPEALLSFKREFRALQDVRHPNLVDLGELFEEQGTWFFTMEYVRGTSFLDYARRKDAAAGVPAFDEARLRATLTQLARGLAALHGANKVHRDLKPSNVLVTPEGRAVILDFGVVRDLTRDPDPGDSAIVGTAAFMAPEQATVDTIGPAADWYAVGVMLYQALTGRTPFVGTVTEILSNKLLHEPPPPRTIAPFVPQDLDELCTALLRIDPHKRPSGAEVLRRLGASASTSTPPNHATSSGAIFVGRVAELEQLHLALADVRAGRAATVLVEGESGVGKSCMVRQFTDSLRELNTGAVTLAGRCFERESVPYKAVDDVIDDLRRFLTGLAPSEVEALVPAQAALLCRAFPVLADVPAFAAARDASTAPIVPQEMRARVFAGLRETLDRIARRWPLVVCIDDLQWADADSLALLEALLRPPSPPPFLFVATRRTTGERALVDGSALGEVRKIQVGKLGKAEAEQLVTRLAASGEATEVEARAIAEEAEGHPLFIDELLRLRARTPKTSSRVRLDDALWARAYALGGAERRVVELLAVAGLPVPYDVAAPATSLEVAELFDVVSKLRAAKLVRTDGARRTDAVDTYHDRVRESVLAHLDAPTRTEWHLRLAQALEDHASVDAERLAVHWQEAGRADRAAAYAERAADEAARALAFERAARLYRLCLTLRSGDDAESRRISLLVAEALTNAGRGAEAADVRLALARTSPTLQAIDLRRRAAEQLLCSGHFDRGLATLKEAVSEIGIRFPRSPFTAIVLLIFYRIVLRLRGGALRTKDGTERDPRLVLLADCAWSAASGLLMTDNVLGVYFQSFALVQTLRLGDPARTCHGLSFEALSGGAPDRPRSLALIARARALAAQVATPYTDAMVASAEGGTSYFWGEWAAAAPRLLEAEGLFRDQCVGVTFERNSLHLMLFRVLSYLGDFATLAERLPPAFADAERRQDRYALINMRTLPMLDLAADAYEHVDRELAIVREQLSPQGFHVQHYLELYASGQVDLYAGRGAAAYARAVAGWKSLRRAFLLRVSIIRIQMLDLRGRAAVAAALAEPARREEHLAAARADARALASEDFPWAKALAYLVDAAAALAASDREGAAAHLRSGIAALDAKQMALHAAVARHVLATLVGGSEGAALEAAAAEWMRARGIKNVERMTRMFFPNALDAAPPLAAAAE